MWSGTEWIRNADPSRGKQSRRLRSPVCSAGPCKLHAAHPTAIDTVYRTQVDSVQGISHRGRQSNVRDSKRSSTCIRPNSIGKLWLVVDKWGPTKLTLL